MPHSQFKCVNHNNQIYSWKKSSAHFYFVPSLLLVDGNHAVRLHLPQQHLAPLVGPGAVVLGSRGVATVEQGSSVPLGKIQSSVKDSNADQIR